MSILLKKLELFCTEDTITDIIVVERDGVEFGIDVDIEPEFIVECDVYGRGIQVVDWTINSLIALDDDGQDMGISFDELADFVNAHFYEITQKWVREQGLALV